MRLRSKGLSLFLAFLVHNAIWILAGLAIVSNNIPSFSRAFYVLMGIPTPLFLCCCVANFWGYCKIYEVSERERVFYKRISKVFIVMAIIGIVLMLMCQYGASL